MSWRRVWPERATQSLTIRFCGYQIVRWRDAARRAGWAHVGPWIVKAADLLADQMEAEDEQRRKEEQP